MRFDLAFGFQTLQLVMSRSISYFAVFRFQTLLSPSRRLRQLNLLRKLLRFTR